jgi:hypothetical protein
MFDVNDPAYLLYGPDHGRKVYFLNLDTAVNDALSRGLWYVVVTTGEHGYMADAFADAGWTITPLAGFWQLATYGNGGEGTC